MSPAFFAFLLAPILSQRGDRSPGSDEEGTALQRFLCKGRSHDAVVLRLGRKCARTDAAEVVFGCPLGPASPSGRHCALRADGSRGGTVARRVGKAASRPCGII